MTKDEKIGTVIAALLKISLGRTDNGRAIRAEEARQIARAACLKVGLDWGKYGNRTSLT